MTDKPELWEANFAPLNRHDMTGSWDSSEGSPGPRIELEIATVVRDFRISGTRLHL
jgi:hypothetical protein